MYKPQFFGWEVCTWTLFSIQKRFDFHFYYRNQNKKKVKFGTIPKTTKCSENMINGNEVDVQSVQREHLGSILTSNKHFFKHYATSKV